MKNLVRSTYHFDRDGANWAPDENGPRQGLLDTINLLGITAEELPGADRRAVQCLTDGFTVAQYNRVREIITAAIDKRRRTHADAQANSDFSRNVLAQLQQVEQRWLQADADVVRLIADAQEIHVTGLEPNSAERTALHAAGARPVDA